MSLMQLLVVGRSINESRDAPNRYRLCQKSFPPKFSLRKKQEEVGTLAATVTCQPKTAAPLKESKQPIGLMMPQREQPMAARKFGAIQLPRIDWSRLVSFFQKLSSVLKKCGSRPRILNAKPNQTQPELSLDAVKVVRNELNDSDLEVVAVKNEQSAPQQEMAPIRSGLKAMAFASQKTTSTVGRAAMRLMAVLHT